MASMRRFRRLTRRYWLDVAMVTSAVIFALSYLLILFFPWGRDGAAVGWQGQERQGQTTYFQFFFLGIGQANIQLGLGSGNLHDASIKRRPSLTNVFLRNSSGFFVEDRFMSWGVEFVLPPPVNPIGGIKYMNFSYFPGDAMSHISSFAIQWSILWHFPFCLPFPIAWTIRNDRRKSRKRRNQCAACGYDLRGTLAAGRSECPECGKAHVKADPSRKP